MPHPLFQKIPRQSWSSGHGLRYCPWSHDPEPDSPLLWQCGSQPGHIEPSWTTAWSFDAGLPRNVPHRAIHLFSDGFSILYERDQTLHELHLWAIHPNALAISATELLHPELVSLSGGVEELDGAASLQREDELIQLKIRAADQGCRMVLSRQTGSETPSQRAVSSLLDFDVMQEADLRFDRRLFFWNLWDEDFPERSFVHTSVESILFGLRDPTGPFDSLWIEQGLTNTFALNRLAVCVAGLSWIDPRTALKVIRTASELQTDDGRLPTGMDTRGHIDGTAAWPQLNRAALHVFNQLAAPGNQRALVSRLHSNLMQTLDVLYDSEIDGYRWRSEAESFLPDLYTEDLVTADCTAFLLAEAEAFCSLLIQAGLQDGFEKAGVDQHIHRLRGNLARRFSGEEGYRDQLNGQTPVSRLTLSAVTPLLTDQPATAEREWLADACTRSGQLRHPCGLRDWQHWEDDDTDPPIRLDHQWMLVPGLNRESQIPASLLRSWQQTAQEMISTKTPAPPTETTLLPEAWKKAIRQDPVSTAAWLLHTTALLLRPDREKEPSKFLQWAEQHRRWVISLPATAVILIILGISLMFQAKPVPPRRTIQAMIGLAQHHYLMEEYEASADILQDLMDSRVTQGSIRQLMAKSLFRMGDYEKAEEHFRKLLRGSPNPTVEMNIALTLYQQGRKQEAEEMYREIAETYQASLPALAERAQLCIELIYSESPPQPTTREPDATLRM